MKISRYINIFLLLLIVIASTRKGKSHKKKILIGISSIVVILSFMTVSPIFNCEETHFENVTYNVSIPYSRCDISGSIINCYNGVNIKEVTTLVNVTTNSSCSLINR